MKPTMDHKPRTEPSGISLACLAIIALGSLLTFPAVPGGRAQVGIARTQKPQPATPSPCCQTTTIDAKTQVVTAVEKATGRTFSFKVADRTLLNTLKVGQEVYANFKTRQVSIDGVTPCCPIIALPSPSPSIRVLNSNQGPPQSQRVGGFESLCGGGCVRDLTTGYIWESAPQPTPQTLSQARSYCSSLNDANSVYAPNTLTSDPSALAQGWRVPYLWELATLPDPTLQSSSSSVQPNTNFFSNVQKSYYWAQGGDPGGETQVYARLFGAPFGGVGVVQYQSVSLSVWCVLSPWTTGTSIINIRQ